MIWGFLFAPFLGLKCSHTISSVVSSSLLWSLVYHFFFKCDCLILVHGVTLGTPFHIFHFSVFYSCFASPFHSFSYGFVCACACVRAHVYTNKLDLTGLPIQKGVLEKEGEEPVSSSVDFTIQKYSASVRRQCRMASSWNGCSMSPSFSVSVKQIRPKKAPLISCARPVSRPLAPGRTIPWAFSEPCWP